MHGARSPSDLLDAQTADRGFHDNLVTGCRLLQFSPTWAGRRFRGRMLPPMVRMVAALSVSGFHPILFRHSPVQPQFSVGFRQAASTTITETGIFRRSRRRPARLMEVTRADPVGIASGELPSPKGT